MRTKILAEWWRSDAAVDNHYRNQYEAINGWDPLDPDWETEDDIDFEDEEEGEQ